MNQRFRRKFQDDLTDILLNQSEFGATTCHWRKMNLKWSWENLPFIPWSQ